MSAPEPVNPGLTPAESPDPKIEAYKAALKTEYAKKESELRKALPPPPVLTTGEAMRLQVRLISTMSPKGPEIRVRAPDNSSVEFNCRDEALAHEIFNRLLAPEHRPRKPIYVTPKAPPESPKGAREAVARICCDVFNKARGEEAMADDWLLFTGEADKILSLFREVQLTESPTLGPTDHWQQVEIDAAKWRAQVMAKEIGWAKPGARDTLPTSKEANQIVDGLLTDQHRKERASTPIEGAGDTVEGATSPYYPTKVEVQVVDEGRRGYFGVDVAITLPTPGGNLYLAKGYFSRMPEGAARIIAEYLAIGKEAGKP